MADNEGTITVTLTVPRNMPAGELSELGRQVGLRFSGDVREAERAGGSVTVDLRPEPQEEETDEERQQRIRDMVTKNRVGGL